MTNRIIALQKGALVNFDVQEALAMKKTIDKDMIELSKILAM